MIRPRKTRRGVSLIEAMVAMAIFASGAVGVAYFFSFGRGQIQATNNSRIAARLASAQIETLRAENYTLLASNPDGNDIAIGGVTFTQAWTIGAAASGTNYRQVEVSVTWPQGGAMRNVQLTTLIGP